MSTPGGGLRRSRSGQAPDDRAGGSAGPGASRPGLFSAGWVGLLGAVLAVAAASVVVLSDDVRWLRLAVVAALWAALLVLVVLVRRGAAGCGCVAEAEDEVDRLREAHESEISELEDVLARQREYEESLEHDLRIEVAREVEARHGDEIAVLRAEVERLQVEARSALAARETEVRAPQQRMTALDSGPGVRAADRAPGPVGASMPVPPTVPPPAPSRAAGPIPPAPPAPPAPARPAPAALPAAARAPIARSDPRAASPATDRAPVARLPHPPPERGPVGSPPDRSRSSALDRGSFVDQYVRSAGYDPEPPPDARPEHPAPPPTTTGRTVAELLAAHSAAAGAAARPPRRPEG